MYTVLPGVMGKDRPVHVAVERVCLSDWFPGPIAFSLGPEASPSSREASELQNYRTLTLSTLQGLYSTRRPHQLLFLCFSTRPSSHRCHLPKPLPATLRRYLLVSATASIKVDLKVPNWHHVCGAASPHSRHESLHASPR